MFDDWEGYRCLIKQIEGFSNHIFEVVKETGSTNDDLKAYWFKNKNNYNKTINYNKNNEMNLFSNNLLKDNLQVKPKILVAMHQSKGRGRFVDREWKDEEGKSLLFSFTWSWLHDEVCKSECIKNYTSKRSRFSNICDFFSKRTINLPLSTALAVYLTLKEYLKKCENISLSIKWPNDIYVNNKKISGILCETEVVSNFEIRAVIGIGVNIYKFEFAQDLSNYISLQEVGVIVEHFELLRRILENWYKVEYKICDAELIDLVNEACSSWFNKTVTLTKPDGKRVKGVIKRLVFPGGMAWFCENSENGNADAVEKTKEYMILSAEIV